MPEEQLPDYRFCPSCPEIKRKIDRIDLALMGEDGTGMKSGIVKAITDLQKNNKVQSSWVNLAKQLAIPTLTFVIGSGFVYLLLKVWL